VPSATAITTRSFVEKVYGELGQRARLSTLPRFAITLLGQFDDNDNIGELREMLYQFERDFVMDSSRFESTFGAQPTPPDESIRQTLDWYRSRL